MKALILLLLSFLACPLHAANWIYIHGGVSADGRVPPGGAEPFHPMRLDDNGPRGLSRFRDLVRAEGHRITEAYDRDTTLDAAFLKDVHVIVFGLHQKVWSDTEKDALHRWLENGGHILIYSDSAAGGAWNKVGGQNPVGQRVANNLLARYGLELTVDQTDGVMAVRAPPGGTDPLVRDRPVLEGEGVSPVAVDPRSGAEILIPYSDHPEVAVSGKPKVKHRQNLTIQDPRFGALVRRKVGEGSIIALFDRQPFWNQGEGSDIQKRDNLEILRRIVREVSAP